MKTAHLDCLDMQTALAPGKVHFVSEERPLSLSPRHDQLHLSAAKALPKVVSALEPLVQHVSTAFALEHTPAASSAATALPTD